MDGRPRLAARAASPAPRRVNGATSHVRGAWALRRLRSTHGRARTLRHSAGSSPTAIAGQGRSPRSHAEPVGTPWGSCPAEYKRTDRVSHRPVDPRSASLGVSIGGPKVEGAEAVVLARGPGPVQPTPSGRRVGPRRHPGCCFEAVVQANPQNPLSMIGGNGGVSPGGHTIFCTGGSNDQWNPVCDYVAGQ
jgi:hypothetical protein